MGRLPKDCLTGDGVAALALPHMLSGEMVSPCTSTPALPHWLSRHLVSALLCRSLATLAEAGLYAQL